ncbi:MAG TPA: uroporphyrinogen decarboxylase family protein, partial [Candidatus Limiplasma sp.]|nr:uroporphyrinogen decarboxylase family protein [Candidatus Limiplasma sp.]
SEKRVDEALFRKLAQESDTREMPLGLYVGSLYGRIRNMLGVEELSYLAMDDEDLYREIIDVVGDLCYRVAEKVLSYGVEFDYAHYWEDICFKNGPLINPAVFRELVAPHYARISKLLQSNGIDITSVDCDGCVDLLVPIWLESGVNTMFPIEVGTWNASIAPWREKYGKTLRGVGGMDKRVFALDKAAVDAEIERLKPLVDLGGYIPCPDHRIPPDADFAITAYYCQAFRKAFG